MTISLSPKEKDILIQILNRYIPGIPVFGYGSRSTGKSKPFSDLDLVIKSNTSISIDTMANLKETLSESDLPFRVDIQVWADLSQEFQQSISRDLISL